jgi:acyl carrier protein
MNSNDVKDKLIVFFQNNILYNESINEIDFDASLIDSAIIDSIGIIMLVSFIEKTFDFRVNDQEILPENFETINRINKYIDSKLFIKR